MMCCDRRGKVFTKIVGQLAHGAYGFDLSKAPSDRLSNAANGCQVSRMRVWVYHTLPS